MKATCPGQRAPAIPGDRAAPDTGASLEGAPGPEARGALETQGASAGDAASVREGRGAGRTLVTGANGFLGSWVVRRLHARGRPVRVMVRSSSALRNLADTLSSVEVARGDKTDAASIRAAVEGCTSVLDCAVDLRTWAKQEELDRTNVLGTRNLLEAARALGVESVVYCSTAGTIGRGRGPVATEANEFDWWDEADAYTRSRVLAEGEVRRAAERGLRACTVNPAVTWGPGDHQPTPQGRMLLAIARGKLRFALPVRLCVTDVEDAAEAMIAAEARGRAGERYLIGGETLWMREIFAIVAGLTGLRGRLFEVPLPLAYAAAGAVTAGNAILRRGSTGFTLRTLGTALRMPGYDDTKARVELGYRPRPAREVFARAIAWLVEEGRLRAKGGS